MTSEARTSMDIEQLRVLATAATPGPWEVVRNRGDHWGMREVSGPAISLMGFTIATDVTSERAAQIESDAAFIAACDPQTILALIERVEQLERERDGEREAGEKSARALRLKDEAMGKLMNVCTQEQIERANGGPLP